MVRVATYVKDVDKAISICNVANQLGYETTINIMAISVEGGPLLKECLDQLEAETKAKLEKILTPEQLQQLRPASKLQRHPSFQC